MNDLLVVLREIRDEMKHLNTQIEKMNDNIEAMAETLDDVSDNLNSLYDTVDHNQEKLISEVNVLKGYGTKATLSDISYLLEDIKGNGTFDSISSLNEQLNLLTRYVSNIEIHVTR